MENGYPVESQNDGDEVWESGLNTLQNVAELSSSYLEQSAEPSAEDLPQESYSVEYEYDLGDMSGYSLQTLSTAAILGVCAGFALAIGAALLAYAISAVTSAFRGITTE